MLSFRPPWSGRRAAERAAAAEPAAPATVSAGRGPVRAALRLMAVEPRMLFDGAAVATADVLIPAEKTLPAEHLNHVPVAAADTRSTSEGTMFLDGQAIAGSDKGDVADTDADGDKLTVVGAAAGATGTPVSGSVGVEIVGRYGSFALQADGQYCYAAWGDLKPGETAQDVFTYTVSDGRGGLATTTITIVVHGVGDNGAPQPQADCRDVAVCDAISDGQAVAGNTLGDAADLDPDKDPLCVTGVVAGEPGGTPSGGVGAGIAGCYGTLTMRSDGSYTYVPFAGLNVPAGTSVIDTFTYTVTDPSGLSASTTLTVQVLPCCDGAGNQPPVAVDDARTIFEGQRIDDGQLITGNTFGDRADSDPEGGKLAATGVVAGRSSATQTTGIDQPVAGQWGTLTLCDDGSYVYVPNEAAQSLRAGQTVTDVFSYSIVDPACATANATLTITIIGRNDAPKANDDARCIDVRGTIADGDAVRGNTLGDVADFDVDSGDALSVVGARAGTSSGPVSGGVATGLTGAWGTLTIGADGRYTYVPDARALTVAAGQEVMDVFTYTIRDTEGALATATVSICIEGVDGSAGGGGGGGGGGTGSLLANADQRTTDERTSVSGNVVVGGQPGERPDIDSEGRPITVQGLTAGVTDVAQTGRVGQGVTGAWGTLTLRADGSYTYVPGSVARGLSQGDVVDDVFTYTVRDDAGRTSTTTLTIRVVGLNDAPTANPDARTIDERGTITNGEAIRGNALGDTADTDTDTGDTLTVVGAAAGPRGGPVDGGVGAPIKGDFGTLTIGPDGRYTYVPDPIVLNLRDGERATDTFTYTIRDGAGVTSTATITIRVTGVDAALEANADQRTTDERTGVTGNAVAGGQPGERADVDSEGRPIVVQGVAAGATGTTLTSGVGAPIAGTWGTLVLNADGSYAWTPNAAARGLGQGQLVEDVYTYTVNDGAGGRTSTTTITIRVTGLNDAPVAAPDARTVTVGDRIGDGQAVTGNALGDQRDTDADTGDTIRVIGAAPGTTTGPLAGGVGTPLTGTYGTLTIAPDGSYVYVPGGPAALALAPGQSVRDTFTYTIDDGHGGRSSTTIAFAVIGANHPPTANPDGKVITVGATDPVTGNSVANGTVGDQPDTDPDKGDTLTVTAVRAGTDAAAAPAKPGDPVKGAYGTLVLKPDGSYSYVLDNANPTVAGLAVGGRLLDTFTYTIRDGSGATSSSTVTIEIVRPGQAAGAPPVSPVPTPLNPTTTPGVGGSYGALTPVYSDVGTKPPTETTPPAATDPFNPFGVERVKGAIEEKDGSSMSEEAPEVASAKQPVRPGDDCIPEDKALAQRKAVVAKDAPKPKAKPSVFAKDLGTPSKSFSEQVTAAKKRFKPPVKVRPPVATQRIC